MNSSANSNSAAEAAIIDLRLTDVAADAALSAPAGPVLEATILQEATLGHSAESSIAPAIVKILGISAVSGAALSVITPTIGWQHLQLPQLDPADNKVAANPQKTRAVLQPQPSQPRLADGRLPSFSTYRPTALAGPVETAPMVSSRLPAALQISQRPLTPRPTPLLSTSLAKPITVELPVVTAPVPAASASVARPAARPALRETASQRRWSRGELSILPTVTSVRPASLAQIPGPALARADRPNALPAKAVERSSAAVPTTSSVAAPAPRMADAAIAPPLAAAAPLDSSVLGSDPEAAQPALMAQAVQAADVTASESAPTAATSPAAAGHQSASAALAVSSVDQAAVPTAEREAAVEAALETVPQAAEIPETASEPVAETTAMTATDRPQPLTLAEVFPEAVVQTPAAELTEAQTETGPSAVLEDETLAAIAQLPDAERVLRLLALDRRDAKKLSLRSQLLAQHLSKSVDKLR
ncbi:MAG: hypothetical protein F6J97_19135 [Leptolyngbya sp. SIO4C1]|nr:hypothetical protein [Leptolyngbya sp. SIO4C1]